MQYMSDAGSPRPASIRTSDPLQRSALPARRPSDPVRDALVIASVFASVLVGCVALKTLFSNSSLDVSVIQAPR